MVRKKKPIILNAPKKRGGLTVGKTTLVKKTTKKKKPIILTAPKKKKSSKRKKRTKKPSITVGKTKLVSKQKPISKPKEREPIVLEAPERKKGVVETVANILTAPLKLFAGQTAGVTPVSADDEGKAAFNIEKAVKLTGNILAGASIGIAAGGIGARAAVGKLPTAKTIPQINVAKVAKEFGLTRAQQAGLAKEIGRRRVSEVATQAIAASGYATNAKTIAATAGIAQKAGMAVGVAAIVGTLVGTYPFAEFELAEATDKIGIAMFKASNEGDFETVLELTEFMDELLNPSAWENIISKIPFANVIQSVRKNIEAAQVASDVYKKLAEDARKKSEEEPEETFEESSKRLAKERRELELTERAEDEAFFEDIKEQAKKDKKIEREEDAAFFEKIEDDRKEAKKIEREEDAAFWDDIAEQRKAEKDKERAEDDVYWEKIHAENAKRKADDRTADETYWAEIKGTPCPELITTVIDSVNSRSAPFASALVSSHLNITGNSVSTINISSLVIKIR